MWIEVSESRHEYTVGNVVQGYIELVPVLDLWKATVLGSSFSPTFNTEYGAKEYVERNIARADGSSV